MSAVLVLRPEPGSSATLAAAQAMGLNAHSSPLFAIEPRDWSAPDPAGFDGLLVGSANAFRHGGPQLENLRRHPAHVVGAATAEAARVAGFTVARTGSGGLQRVLDDIPAGTRLLRLAGEERITLTPPAGVTIAEVVVYASTPRPLDAAAVRGSPVVLLHSAEAARHFAAECERLGLDRSAIALATIGPRVTGAAGSGWGAVETASEPSDAALLALAARMCQRAAR